MRTCGALFLPSPLAGEGQGEGSTGACYICRRAPLTDAAVIEAPKNKRRPRDRWRATGWKFAAPGLSIIAIGLGFPLVYALLLSLSSFTLLKPKLQPFVGLENFRSVMAGEYFWNSVWITIKYSAVTVAGEFVLGLVAQDVQDALLEKYGRWPLCPVCEDDPHALEVEPELGAEPHWVCAKAAVIVAPVGALS